VKVKQDGERVRRGKLGKVKQHEGKSKRLSGHAEE
jgi:hypothetical protein